MPAAPRSTTTKQLDCWISSRSRLEVGGNLYSLRKMVYQPASWFSTSDTVPRGLEHFCNCELSLAAVAPPAAPVATVFASGLPMRMLVVSQPVSSTAAHAAASNGSVFLDMSVSSLGESIVRVANEQRRSLSAMPQTGHMGFPWATCGRG
jgi:hypothetical protein